MKIGVCLKIGEALFFALAITELCDSDGIFTGNWPHTGGASKGVANLKIINKKLDLKIKE